MRCAHGPWIVAVTVARAATTAAVAEIDASIHVKRVGDERRARGIRLAMARRARAGKVTDRRRRVAIATGHRVRIGPHRARASAAAVMTRDGALARRAIVTCLRADDCLVENDFRRSISVNAGDDVARGHGMARRASERGRAQRRRLDVGAMCARSSCVGRKEARVAGRVGPHLVAVTRVAREHALGLGVARRASGRRRRGARHAGWTRGRAVVATAARLAVVRVEHRSPALVAKLLAVPIGRARIDNPRSVHGSSKRGRSGAHPCLEDASLGGIYDTLVRGRVEGAHDGRRAVGGQRRRRAGTADACDRVEVRCRAPSTRGRRRGVARSASTSENRSYVLAVHRRRFIGLALRDARRTGEPSEESRQHERRPRCSTTRSQRARHGRRPQAHRRGTVGKARCEPSSSMGAMTQHLHATRNRFVAARRRKGETSEVERACFVLISPRECRQDPTSTSIASTPSSSLASRGPMGARW